VWEAIPNGWWPMSETCKFMLACLVHKDNKDISSGPTKLPPGRSRVDARKEKGRAISEERSKAKAERPVPAAQSAQERYGEVDHAIKKARVEGMKSHAAKVDVDMIILQVNVMHENAEFYKKKHGEHKYESMIVNLLNQLPGVPRSVGTESSTEQSSTPTGRRGMEVDLTTDLGDPLEDDDSLLNDDNV
jgi:hypothetical protein